MRAWNKHILILPLVLALLCGSTLDARTRTTRKNLRSLEVPVAAKILVPYAFSGPNFSLLFKEDEASTMENSKTTMSWDIGAGVELFSHLRVSASYGIGLTKSLEMVNEDATKSGSKDNCWTVSATYLF